jgi:hypothetical protein
MHSTSQRVSFTTQTFILGQDYTILICTYPWFMPFLQDTVLTVPQNPFDLEDPSNIPF